MVCLFLFFFFLIIVWRHFSHFSINKRNRIPTPQTPLHWFAMRPTQSIKVVLIRARGRETSFTQRCEYSQRCNTVCPQTVNYTTPAVIDLTWAPRVRAPTRWRAGELSWNVWFPSVLRCVGVEKSQQVNSNTLFFHVAEKARDRWWWIILNRILRSQTYWYSESRHMRESLYTVYIRLLRRKVYRSYFIQTWKLFSLQKLNLASQVQCKGHSLWSRASKPDWKKQRENFINHLSRLYIEMFKRPEWEMTWNEISTVVSHI